MIIIFQLNWNYVILKEIITLNDIFIPHLQLTTETNEVVHVNFKIFNCKTIILNSLQLNNNSFLHKRFVNSRKMYSILNFIKIMKYDQNIST